MTLHSCCAWWVLIMNFSFSRVNQISKTTKRNSARNNWTIEHFTDVHSIGLPLMVMQVANLLYTSLTDTKPQSFPPPCSLVWSSQVFSSERNYRKEKLGLKNYRKEWVPWKLDLIWGILGMEHLANWYLLFWDGKGSRGCHGRGTAWGEGQHKFDPEKQQ